MLNPRKTVYEGPITTARLRIGPFDGSSAPALTIAVVRPADPDRLLDASDVSAWNRVDDYMPYWAYLWPGAYLLGAAVAAEPGIGPGSDLLEIGCGLGLAGLTALGKGARTTFTDYDEAPFPLIEASVLANGFDSANAQTERLDWRDLPNHRRFPWILGADVLYERRLVPLVANLLGRMLEPAGTALIADPYRVAAEGFAAALGPLGLRTEASKVSIETDQFQTVNGTIHRVRRV